ncbi:hypothetical protein [Psychromicrobium sp. YIM B11713]|uniref:hypothetical protein n=1 Tax=Psychromicrobium sp. YIM B11713 TaxID=3145233 RepID=UPI00374E8E02
MSETPGTPEPQQPSGYRPPQQPAPSIQTPGYPTDGRQQSGYPQGYQPPTPAGKALPVVALVLGILAILLCWIPFIGLVSVLLGLGAVICGAIALSRRDSSKVMPAIGGSLGVLGLVASIVVSMIAFTAVSNAFKEDLNKIPTEFSSGFPSILPSDLDKEHTFKLVTSSAADAVVKYAVGEQADSNVPIKGNWEKEITGKAALGLASLSVSSSAANQVSCEIFIDGKSVVKRSGTGSVFCLGSVRG